MKSCKRAEESNPCVKAASFPQLQFVIPYVLFVFGCSQFDGAFCLPIGVSKSPWLESSGRAQSHGTASPAEDKLTHPWDLP